MVFILNGNYKADKNSVTFEKRKRKIAEFWKKISETFLKILLRIQKREKCCAENWKVENLPNFEHNRNDAESWTAYELYNERSSIFFMFSELTHKKKQWKNGMLKSLLNKNWIAKNNAIRQHTFAAMAWAWFFLRKNAVHSNLISIFVMFCVESQATAASVGTLCVILAERKRNQ